MNRAIRPILLNCTLIASLTLAPMSIVAQEVSDSAPPWDATVNSLLAAGLYGLDAEDGRQGFSVQFQQHKDPYLGLSADQDKLTGQAITFSYDGSAGLLGFSAGYIFTSEPSSEQPGTVFLGIDSAEDTTFNPTRSWYMAFDLSQTYQMGDNLSFGLGSTTMLSKDPFATKEGKIFSMLFNMPLSYKNYLTITPEFQWSRKLPDLPGALQSNVEGKDKDTFYGGVSVTFSY